MMYDFVDRNCDTDIDVIVYDPSTSQFSAHESTYTQNGQHNYNSEVLMTTQGDNAVIAWTHYDGPNYGWTPRIPLNSNSIIVFEDLDGVCDGYLNLSSLEQETYTGDILVFNPTGQRVYEGPYLSDQELGQKGLSSGIYLIKKPDGIDVKKIYIH